MLLFLSLVSLLGLLNSCILPKEEREFETEITSILMEVFRNYKLQSSRTTLEVTEVNYSATYFSNSYSKFLEIKPSLEDALKKNNYLIKSSISVNEITITIGDKNIKMPAQIQIEAERITNNEVRIIITKKNKNQVSCFHPFFINKEKFKILVIINYCEKNARGHNYRSGRG